MNTDLSLPNAASEDRLATLIAANGETERKTWAERAKRGGKKLIGIPDYYIPEELVIAAGAVPFRVTGTWSSDVSRASYYRTMKTDLYCTHVLEALLSGELDYLDGIICTDFDDDLRRLGDVFEHIDKPAFRPVVHVPHNDTELAVNHFAEELAILARAIETFTGCKISPDSLRNAIAEVNRTRDLLRHIYTLRQRDKPPLTGAEMLGLVTAAQVVPKAEFNQELGALADLIEQREAPVKALHPRVMVAGDRFDHPAYLRLVEEAGAVIATDDLDTGIRYVAENVELHDDGDLYGALARRYLLKAPNPGMFFWAKSFDQLIGRIQEFNVDGVVNFTQRQSVDRPMRWPSLRVRLDAAGIPSISVINDYAFSNEGPLRTRLEAFVEMLAAS